MQTLRWLGVAALALTGLFLPPAGIASAVAGPGLQAAVTQGLWILKLLLLLHAAVLAAAPAIPVAGSGTLLPAAEPAPASPADRWAVPVLVLLLALGLALRLVALGRGLWIDEIQTLVDYVRLPLGRILTTFDSQNQHLLYTISARFSFDLLGDGPAALRLPAALFGVASLWATWRLARAVTSTAEALLATALLTVSYHHVWFSQNARGYTGLLCFTLIGTAAFLRLLRDPEAGWGSIGMYAVSMALAAYTHITAVFTSVAHLLCLLGAWWFSPGRRARPTLRPALGLLLSGSAALLLYAPVLPQFVGTLLRESPQAADTQWEHPLWLIRETLQGLARGLPGGWLGLLAGATVTLAGLWSYWRQSRTLVALLVLPVALTVAAMIALGHNLWPRFFFFAAGFAVLIAVRGGFTLCRLVLGRRGELIASAATALAAVGSLLTVPRAWLPKQDFEGAAKFVESSRAREDAVVTVDLTTYPFASWLGRDWTDVPGEDSLEAVEQRHGRTWVLYTFPVRLAAVQPEVWARLQAHYDTAAVYPGTVGGGAIVVMVSRRANT